MTLTSLATKKIIARFESPSEAPKSGAISKAYSRKRVRLPDNAHVEETLGWPCRLLLGRQAPRPPRTIKVQEHGFESVGGKTLRSGRELAVADLNAKTKSVNCVNVDR